MNAAMVDVAFAIRGGVVTADYRQPLAAALEALLPWLAETPGAGVHRLKLAGAHSGQTLLSRRTQLVLRVPHLRAAGAAALAGCTLAVGEGRIEVGEAHERELVPWGTLYAHLVASPDDDELAFLDAVGAELDALKVRARAICGRHQVLAGRGIQGFALMLDGLDAEASLRVLEAGIGAGRRLGLGLFVPHKSAAAVGTPP